MIANICTDRSWISQATDIAMLQNELHQLMDHDDDGSLLRRFELHLALAWMVLEMGTTRGQEQAELGLAIARSVHNRLWEADALHALAQVYLTECYDPAWPEKHPTQEESRTAQQLHEQALQIREQLLGPDHPEVARSLLYIVAQGRLWAPFAPYVALAERAVQICERVLGADHEQTASALEQLARLQRTTNQQTDSRDTYVRVLQIYRRTFGPNDNNHTANAASELAWAHMALGEYEAALELMDDVLVIRQRTFGAYSDTALHAMLFRSDVLRKQGKLVVAAAEEGHILATLEGELGPDHPTTIAFVQLLASRGGPRRQLDSTTVTPPRDCQL
jgi:tetratricopeptide (TPR) repeat protein